jgi:hypothetical protein
MAALLLEPDPVLVNPLDAAERIVTERNWAFDRPLEDELVAEVSGAWCNFRIWFTWQPDLGAVMFSCALDMKVPAARRAAAYPLLSLINERMWIGHFDIGSEDGGLTFRQSVLLKGGGRFSEAQAEELMDIAIVECERFYPAFQSVIWAAQSPEDALRLALFETFGEA